MTRTPLSIPEIAIIGGTRAALGVGLGLLLADRLSHEQRRAVGWTLFAVGAVTTIPIAVQLRRAQWDNGVGGGRPAARFEGRREYAS
jgi:hypothetical protein